MRSLEIPEPSIKGKGKNVIKLRVTIELFDSPGNITIAQ
jgi:hypothetical protein